MKKILALLLSLMLVLSLAACGGDDTTDTPVDEDPAPVTDEAGTPAEDEEVPEGRISMVAERYPELKADKNYAKCMDAVDSYEKMVRTSRLIYNDSVTKLNREIRMFPTSLVAGALGFHARDYLEHQEGKADMPDMK